MALYEVLEDGTVAKKAGNSYGGGTSTNDFICMGNSAEYTKANEVFQISNVSPTEILSQKGTWQTNNGIVTLPANTNYKYVKISYSVSGLSTITNNYASITAGCVIDGNLQLMTRSPYVYGGGASSSFNISSYAIMELDNTVEHTFYISVHGPYNFNFKYAQGTVLTIELLKE